MESTALAWALALSAIGAQPPAQPAAEYERLILGRGDGLVTVADLDLPPEFVRHVADRSVRADFRMRLWSCEPQEQLEAQAPPHFAGVPMPPPHGLAERLTVWSGLTAGVPRLRGFRTPLESNDAWPIDAPPGEGPGDYEDAARFVAGHLARDGLVLTVMSVMRRFDLPWLAAGRLDPATLRAAGIPADLLEHFSVRGRALPDVLADWAMRGMRADQVEPTESGAAFVFRPSAPGFAVMAEDGSEPVGAFRLQIPTDRFVRGPGDGFALDVLRQIVLELPEIDVWLGVHWEHEAGVRGWLERWSIPRPQRVRVLPTGLRVSPWAQDNGKAGLAPTATGTRPLTLVPRFATTNEQSSRFVPGDSFVFEVLAAHGVTDVAVSPLLFQGGNLVPFVDPATGRRILLVGEAEVHRNRALGLTAEQVLSAMRAEFGVDRCVVLPAVSLHLDLELTVRRCGDRLVACVNDDLAAAQIIVREGVRAMGEAGMIRRIDHDMMIKWIDRGEAILMAGVIEQLMVEARGGRRTISGNVAAVFAPSPLQTPTASFHRFLAAVYILVAEVATPVELARMPAANRRYLESLQRRRAGRAEIRRRLEALGIEVRPVPGTGDAGQGVSYVNGVHLTDAYLMPVYGGLYEALDAAGGEAIAEAFGADVRIVPIDTAGIQGLLGGVHCMTGIYPPGP